MGLIGPGKVGRALLQQLADTAHRYGHNEGMRGLDLRLRAIADSRRMTLAARALSPTR